ncbi:MAG: N-acyl homoserine lactonase family protein [Actinobacteria bacterium]|nr:N-acyl homoserine lactonase family protein [Actinomycetota bacterium]
MSEVEIHALHCGGDMTDWGIFDPLDERRGEMVYNPYFVYVVKHPEGVVLFDSGAHPDLATDPVGRMGAGAEEFVVKLDAGDAIEPVLARIGLTPDDIDLVIQSHLHFDHAGGLYAFPSTPVMVQRAELEFAEDPPAEQREIYIADDFAPVTDWRLVDGEEDVFGDGRLIVIPTPGHTKGHQSLLVRLDDGREIFLLADAAYLLEKMRLRRPPGVLWEEGAILETWDRIEALEREHDAFLITTHDLDYEERIEIAPRGFYG